MNILKKIFGKGKKEDVTEQTTVTKPEAAPAPAVKPETAPASAPAEKVVSTKPTSAKQEEKVQASATPKTAPKKTAPKTNAAAPSASTATTEKTAPKKPAEKKPVSQANPATAAAEPQALKKTAQTKPVAPKNEEKSAKTETKSTMPKETQAKAEKTTDKVEEKVQKEEKTPKMPKVNKNAPKKEETIAEPVVVEDTLPTEESGTNTLLGKFVIKPAKNNDLMFNLKASNGEVIATSDMYSSMEKCKKGIASVQLNAPIANLEDHTVDGALEEVVNPKFEMYVDKGGAFRFRLRARNGEIIAKSQGYTSKTNCRNGIESVRKNAMSDIIVVEGNDTAENDK